MEMTVAVQMKINNTDDGKTMIILRLQSSMKDNESLSKKADNTLWAKLD